MSHTVQLGKTLAEQLVEILADQIVDGVLRPGQQLSEAELAASFGTSRTPVREALKVLESSGLVRNSPRQHAIVSPLTAEDCADLYKARILLEGYSVQTTAPVITDHQLSGLRASLEKMREAVAQGDMRGYQENNRNFHVYLYECGPSNTVRQLIAQLWRKTLRYSSLLFHEERRLEKSLKFHEEIFAALVDRDGKTASDLLRVLLRDGQEAIASRLRAEAAGEP